jgi:uncharacterized protein YdeI (YjbR/CyaY-like superfamily)
MEPIFFASAAKFRAWLQRNHAQHTEVIVGFHKKGTGQPTLTWSESVDEALCFGWIDGVRHSAGPDAYTIRFTPRKPSSNWSTVNVAKVRRLTELGKMQRAGIAAYERRTPQRTGVYSFEGPAVELDHEQEAEFRRYPDAWAWYQAQPPSYRRTAAHWVVSAKQQQTRERRLHTLISDSAVRQRIKPLRRKSP